MLVLPGHAGIMPVTVTEKKTLLTIGILVKFFPVNRQYQKKNGMDDHFTTNICRSF